MKAILHSRYGAPEVLRYEEITMPAAGDNEVLVRVRAASVNPLDWHLMRGTPYPLRMAAGLGKPKSPRVGADVAGLVEKVGRNVTEFRAGDEIFGSCQGAFAEYVCTRESALVKKPANVTFEQAASAPVAGFTALQALRDKGQIQPGQRVLVNGAAGGVGTFAVQIARSFGADVTGVCSTKNMEMVRSIGADRVIDYTREDFTAGGQRYDLILDCIGNRSLSACRRVMMPTGTFIVIGAPDGRWIGPLAAFIKAPLLSLFVSQTMTVVMTKGKKEDLIVLQQLLESGKVVPVIDRRYSLAETPQAIRYLEQGHARGKVVIVI